ncbi:Lrp/AsnC family transcriptional regulator [Nocardioides sp. Iso805N]|uniref:Lrp/AsnC family transcriptional regulator n=1 Tax=Nocardioides sp. Iso805N TaxID=1283287 RepID=UPI00036F9A71|nr:Lrp/AsnC family transcriptional regulator [Nocardioides sp. Iso805N]
MRESKESAEITETDLVIIEALQLSPRATWARIGSATDVDPTTAARRWRRLAESGMAWITAYQVSHAQRPLRAGFVDITCHPEAVRRVADELASWPAVASVERTTAAAQLFCLTLAESLSDLDDLVHRNVAEIPGVTGTSVRIATRPYREGSEWLVRALSGAQRAQLTDGSPAKPTTRDLLPEEQSIAMPLGIDGRRSSAEIAAALGYPEALVRRRISRLVRDRVLRFRCDVSHVLAGWPVIAQLRLRVPGDRLDTIGKALATLPQTRLCLATTGAENLLVQVWLRSPDEVADLEHTITRRFPEVSVGCRDITLRAVKRMGRLLDDRGRNIGYVPVASWSASARA